MSVGDSLELKNATKYYKKFKAVDDVNLSVHKGEFLTILGPSGSGKTSLLKLIAGFEGLSSGSILLNNQDITKKKAYEREIGMMFQNYALFPHMTVYENVAYPLKLRKLPRHEIKTKVEDILRLVRLSDFAYRFPKELSGGQQQRVALARAIVFNPPLLLLDEPLGALDKNLRQQMQIEIKHIQAKVGITTISVTHDQEEALTMSDRICVMNHGRIEQIDTPENLYNKPKNRFVAEFIGEINLLKAEYIGTEAGQARVKILGEQITSIRLENISGELRHRQSALIAVRPENIQIFEPGSPLQHGIKAKVRNLVYVGDAVKVKTSTETGEEITLRVPSRLSDAVSCGKEILLGWESQYASMIPDEATA
ncbi:ABC transporter ATP-binding protein [Ferviditalea candida]|uniref:Spermidine/putrescine import ATP-binding protein PotA n=1 Tax=Ferviditalea candida TaxID=3108399 RepID=A0ABU5ZIN1_9BACL|nr:ABC transporter ATP-binding protein [Paenibacillaceae bacterium T2]